MPLLRLPVVSREDLVCRLGERALHNQSSYTTTEFSSNLACTKSFIQRMCLLFSFHNTLHSKSYVFLFFSPIDGTMIVCLFFLWGGGGRVENMFFFLSFLFFFNSLPLPILKHCLFTICPYIHNSLSKDTCHPKYIVLDLQ